MKKSIFTLVIVVFCSSSSTLIWGQQDERESFVLKDSGVPFGFTNDPIHAYVPSYTNLTFDDLFYFGLCSIYSPGTAIYGPCLYYTDKIIQYGYPIPIHTWGVSFDTVFRLNTDALKNKMIQNPEKFAQKRFVHTRIKAWDFTQQVVLVNLYKPQWTADGHITNDPAIPAYADYGTTLGFFDIRVQSDGSNFHFWDCPAITELIFWTFPYVDCAIKYNNFVVQFCEELPAPIGWTSHQQLDLYFYTKAVACIDYDCDWGINGDAESGLGTINIPDWSYRPSCSF